MAVPERPVLVAPDSFKGTFRASEVAGAIGRGLERAGLMPPDLCLVAVGGSATTDGGAGALEGIEAGGGLRGARLVVLCDVRTVFEDAARVFGPQKGAAPDVVERLRERLEALARRL